MCLSTEEWTEEQLARAIVYLYNRLSLRTLGEPQLPEDVQDAVAWSREVAA